MRYSEQHRNTFFFFSCIYTITFDLINCELCNRNVTQFASSNGNNEITKTDKVRGPIVSSKTEFETSSCDCISISLSTPHSLWKHPSVPVYIVVPGIRIRPLHFMLVLPVATLATETPAYHRRQPNWAIGSRSMPTQQQITF